MPNNLVCPADYTQNGKTCTKSVSNTETCYLYDKNDPNYSTTQACYDSNKKKIPKPNEDSGSGSTGGSKKAFNFRSQCSDVLKGRHSNLVQNIKGLQEFEKKQFNKLQALEKSQVSPGDQSDIIAKINNLADMRGNMFKELKLMMTQEQCTLSNDRYNLSDQLSLLAVTEKELNNIKGGIGHLKQSRDNKLRMVEITNYEANRYESHKTIFKNFAFCSLGVLISVYLINAGWPSLGKAGIVISIAAAVMLTMRKIYDNWYRSNMNWNRYNWDFDKAAATKGYETVYGHDKKAFWKGVSQAKAQVSSAENTGLEYWNKAKKQATKLSKNI
jgi:hypothetical protein